MPTTPIRRERSDAARNRRAVLDAAQELIERRGPEHVSLDLVATAAGVGKGTVFRRFGNRAGLLRELHEERAAGIRAAIAAADGPLGTQAPHRERLLAFLDALADLAARNAALLAEHEHTCAANKYDDPTYRIWHRHLVELLGVLRPGLDADFAAHTLLATLDGRLINRMAAEGDPDRFGRGLHALVDRLLTAPAD